VNGRPSVAYKADAAETNIPVLSNGSVRLRALSLRDTEWLRDAETDEFLAFRWRLHGAHPNPFDAEQIWVGALALFVVERASDASVMGILSAYQADQRNGHCRVAAARLEPGKSMDTGFMSAVAIFFDYLFGGWPFRKLYLETPEFNVPQFASVIDRGLMSVEARLREFVFLSGRYWDMLFLSVSRETWNLFRSSRPGQHLLGFPGADM
jgi:hypothetical protein